MATLSLPGGQRAALVNLMERDGRRHPTGTVTIPLDCIMAVVHYTSRTPARGQLREAFVVSIEPADGVHHRERRPRGQRAEYAERSWVIRRGDEPRESTEAQTRVSRLRRG
jgi:hypothetical protein